MIEKFYLTVLMCSSFIQVIETQKIKTENSTKRDWS